MPSAKRPYSATSSDKNQDELIGCEYDTQKTTNRKKITENQEKDRESAPKGAVKNSRNENADEVKHPPSKKRKTSKSKTNAEETNKFDVSDIHLEGEENDAVPVYET